MLEILAGFSVKPNPQTPGRKCSPERLAKAKAYRESNGPAIRAAQKAWAEKNKEYARAYKKARQIEYKELYAERKRIAREAAPEKELLSSARKRAKKYGVTFTIELKDISVPEFCPITGLRLKVSAGRFTAASPSLDRVDNGLGYIPGNVRVISYKANSYKGDMTKAEIERLAQYVRGEI